MSLSRKPRLSSDIPLAGVVWIASDIHLGPDTPDTARAFRDFLDQASAQADALILCGDVFDAWIGDDFALHSPPEWLASFVVELKDVSARIPVWIGRGNRDFLMGERLMALTGASLLPEPARLHTDAGTILLTHGDEYCTADPAYQRFRRIVRQPGVQRLFLGLSLKLRRGIADWARRRSMASNRYKAATIMDVDPQAIAQAYARHGVDTLVHGHTHRPGTHHITVDGARCTRIVLPDWDYEQDPPRGGWLVIDRDGLRLVQASKSN